jgi:hypothetical protein
MGAFILAGLVFVGAILLAGFVSFAQGMAAAPHYDNTPRSILIGGVVLAALIAASHWLPHIGW